MSPFKVNTRLRWLLIVVLVLCCIGFLLVKYSAERGRLRLPAGSRTPVISLGFSHGLILAADGSLWTWGDEELGWPVLGLGKNRTTSRLRRIGNDTNWVSVSAGEYHNLAVKDDGSLWAWGGNFRYQLGDGTKTNRNTPVRSLPGNGWKQAAAGGAAYSVALKKDGTLWAWGANWGGQLGIGSTSNTTVAVQVGTCTNWTRIWAQGVQTVAQQADGSLWFCGSLTGSSTDTNKILVLTRVSPDTNWVDVCFGDFTVLAIKSDGTLWAWGREARDYAGGSGNLADLYPLRIGTDANWQACSSFGTRYHLLRKTDGSLWELNAPDYGSGRPAAGFPALKVKRLDLQKDALAFGAGRGAIGIVMTRDGEVWTWGRVFGEPALQDRLWRFYGERVAEFGVKVSWRQPTPVTRPQPWQLRNVGSDDSATK